MPSAGGAGRDRLRIVLSRYKKIPGFTDEDVEKATSCKVLWKVPNNYQVIGPAIDKAARWIAGITISAAPIRDSPRTGGCDHSRRRRTLAALPT